MIGFLAGRAASLALVLFGASILIFLVVRALPGDPAVALMTQNATPEMIAEMRRTLGLERALPAQFALWLGAALGGDLGRSFMFSMDVSALIGERFPVTLYLALTSLAIALAIAVPTGVLAAANKGKALDHLCRVVAMVGISMPVFWQGLLMILLFAVTLGWLPPGAACAPEMRKV